MGKKIAELLGLKNPQRYTGQCWRGTAATVLADAGFSKPQIKAVTGHKSDKAVDVYIANSMVQKSSSVHALSINKRPRTEGNIKIHFVIFNYSQLIIIN